MFRIIIYTTLLWVGFYQVSHGQDLEPRRWSHLPIDTNFIGVAYARTEGNIYLDPVLRIEEVKANINTAIASYLRSFGLLGKTARIDVLVPFQDAHWDGLVNGEPTVAERSGVGDPRIRLSFNFLGSPALKGKEFNNYHTTNAKNTVAGIALSIRVPLGQYYNDKLLNLGSNRYTIRPQLGFVHTWGPWSFELSGSVLFFTDNDDFWNGNRREQNPLFATQSHLIYTFRPGLWASVSAGYDYGGESTINGNKKDDTRSDNLYALSAGYPVSRTTSIKLAYVRGRTREDVGSDTDNFILAFTKMF